jgi:hypothetical protein
LWDKKKKSFGGGRPSMAHANIALLGLVSIAIVFHTLSAVEAKFVRLPRGVVYDDKVSEAAPVAYTFATNGTESAISVRLIRRIKFDHS